MNISMGDDRLDSRDILERIENLELEQDDAHTKEIAMWRKILAEAADYAGASPKDGIFFVKDSYWKNYAIEYADDIGSLTDYARSVQRYFSSVEYEPVDLSTQWPFRHIDWDAAADELREDYTSVDVEWDGSTYTYWYR
jgi:hypothetical protein